MPVITAPDGIQIVRGLDAEQTLKKPDVALRLRAADGLAGLLTDALHDRHPHGVSQELHHA